MTTPIYFPTISETGWATSTTQIVDHLFAQFFESDYSQTQIYPGKVSSLAWLIANHHSNSGDLTIAIQNTLTIYFGRYFENVTVEARLADDPEDSSKQNLVIYADFVDRDGIKQSLGKLVSLVNSKVAKVVSVNNNGI